MIEKLNIEILKKKINNKNILITGGTGSFGNHFVETIIKNNLKPKKIIIFSRDEFKQFHMMKKYPEEKYYFMRYLVGDIRDYNRLEYAFKNVDIIFHAAALKHVPIIEYNPLEAIKTNINGTENVVKAAIKNNVDYVIALSTDKCVEPCNLYGATKLCLEKIVIAGNSFSGLNLIDKSTYNKTKFSVLRYGNVLGSRGSVLPLFKEHSKNGLIKITDKRMTRFTLTLTHAINFVLNSFCEMIGGEIFVPILPSYNILQLANLIDSKCKKEEIGIRPGEKLFESMISKHESINTIKCNNKYIILPSITGKEVKDIFLNYYKATSCEFGFSYDSNNNVLIDNKVFKEILDNY